MIQYGMEEELAGWATTPYFQPRFNAIDLLWMTGGYAEVILSTQDDRIWPEQL
jgi:hypothetical protein